MRNDGSCNKNCMPAMAHDVVTLGGRIVGITPLMPDVDVARSFLVARSMSLHARQMQGMRSRVVDVSCSMRRVVVGMPRSMRIGSDGAGEHQRKRRPGCNQPGRPRVAFAAHLGS